MPRKKKQQKKDYKGDLNKPIKLPARPFVSALGELDQKALVRLEKKKIDYQSLSLRALNLKMQKMNLLFNHYDISQENPNKWFELSWLLAEDHVEGFRIEEAEVKLFEKKWDEVALAKLYYDVIEYLDVTDNEAHKTISRACKILAKKEEWLIFLAKTSNPARTLQDKYALAKKSTIVNGICASDENTKAIIHVDLKKIIDILFYDKINLSKT